MIVGVSGHVINKRQFTVAPSNQLAEAQQFIQLGKKPRNFVFSHEVGTCIPCVSAVHCNPSSMGSLVPRVHDDAIFY